MTAYQQRYREEAMSVVRAQGGDRAAFDRLVRQYRGMVLAVACARIHDREEAEDLAQEIWARAWAKLHTLKEAVAFPAWLKTLALRTALNRQARRPPTPVSLDEVAEARGLPEDDPVARCLVGEHQRALYDALQALPMPNRLALLLHVCDGYTCEELAALFGVPLTTIEGRVHRAKAQLRRELSHDAYFHHRSALEAGGGKASR